MTDHEFLSYCELHADTDRHLFHVEHVRRLLRLAGDDEARFDLSSTFLGMDREFVAPRVAKARAWLAFVADNPRVAAVTTPAVPT